MEAQEETLILCNACLCVGQKLYQIQDDKYKQFYLDALSEIPLFKMTSQVPAVCWQCRVLLHRAVDFREQVKDSYRILVTYTNENLRECFLSDVSRPSRLDITHNGVVSIEPTYTYELCDQHVKSSPDNCDNQNPHGTNCATVDRVQCTQKVFVKEEQNVKAEFHGSDIDAFYSDSQESPTPIDSLADIDNEIKTIINGIEKRSKKLKRNKLRVDNETKCKFIEGPKYPINEVKLEYLNDTHDPNKDTKDSLEGIENEIKFIMEGIDKKKSIKKMKRNKREMDKVRGTKKKKFKEENSIAEILTIELSNEEMAEERNREYSKDGYVNAEFKCDSCIVGFNNEKSYKSHVASKHSPDIGDYTCPVCKTILSSVDSFTAHYKRHMRRYECSVCQKRTMDIKVMEQHFYTSHGISLKKYKCKECGKISKSIDSHRYHTDTHKSRLQCKDCDKTFRHRGGLLNHRLTVHELRNEFPCNVCDKVFRWKNSLKRHLESHEAKNKLNPNAAFCALCNIGFASLSSYQRHMTNSLKHVTKDDYRFICDHCLRRFSNKTKLRDHIEEKHLHRTYQCAICLKVSKNRVNLDQHIRNVHKGRPNNKMCHHCGKGFPTKVQLESHIRTHTGERPFICEYCPTTFSQQSNLYKHNRQVHMNLKSKRYPVTKKRKEDSIPTDNMVATDYNPIEIEFHIQGVTDIVKNSERF